MGGRAVSTEDILRILPSMIEDERDPTSRARLERTLAHVRHAERLSRSGMSWEDAKADAYDAYPPFTDEELEQAGEAR